MRVDGSTQQVENIDYAMVVGRVSANGKELTSYYDPNQRGVVQSLQISEHGTTWNRYSSYDTSRVISSHTQYVPFSLICNKESGVGDVRVHVEGPLSAAFLTDSLSLTHKHFEPVSESMLAKMMALVVSKEMVRGIETSEQMLLVDTQLTAFGKLSKMSNSAIVAANLASGSGSSASNSFLWPHMSSPVVHYRLGKPSLSSDFILTTMTRPALVDHLHRGARIYRICLFVFGSIGVALGAYCAYKYASDYLAKRKREQAMAQIKQQRLRHQRARARLYDNEFILNGEVVQSDRQQLSAGSNSTHAAVGDTRDSESEGSATFASSMCVICLTNPRELVLVECGHVCLCMDCQERLPTKTCPICRQAYRSILPCYIP